MKIRAKRQKHDRKASNTLEKLKDLWNEKEGKTEENLHQNMTKSKQYCGKTEKFRNLNIRAKLRENKKKTA